MNFRSGIHVLVKKDDKYLVIKRGKNDFADPLCWDLPGGGIDWGEQPNEAAIRETKEETGVSIKITKLLGSWAIEAQKDWSIEFIAQGDYLSGEVRLSPEHSDYQWVNSDELAKLSPISIHIKALRDHSLVHS